MQLRYPVSRAPLSTVFFLVAQFLCTPQAAANVSLTVTWDAVPGVSGYKLYWRQGKPGKKNTCSPDPAQYPRHIDVGNVTRYVLNGLPPGTRLCMRLTPYQQNADGSLTEGFYNPLAPRANQLTGRLPKAALSLGAQEGGTSSSTFVFHAGGSLGGSLVNSAQIKTKGIFHCWQFTDTPEKLSQAFCAMGLPRKKTWHTFPYPGRNRAILILCAGLPSPLPPTTPPSGMLGPGLDAESACDIRYIDVNTTPRTSWSFPTTPSQTYLRPSMTDPIRPNTIPKIQNAAVILK